MDREASRGRVPPDGGGAGRADWWTASGPSNEGAPNAPTRPASPSPGATQAGGWSAPTRPAPAYGSSGPAGGGAYGGAGSAGGGPGDWSPPRAGAYGGAPSPPSGAYGGPPPAPNNWAAPTAVNPRSPAPPTVPQSPGWPPTPAPAPGYGPNPSYPPRGGPAYGGPPPAPMGGVVRHRPGLGLVLGLMGALALVASLTMLPWVEAGGQEVTFSDIRDAYENVDELTNAPLAPPPAPEGSTGSSGFDASDIPTTGEITETAENTGKNAYLEVYTAWGWIGVLAGVSVAILFATLVVPSSKGGRLVTGFLTAGLLGLLFNVGDDEGRFGPRISGAVATLGAGGLHVAAIWALFSEELSPDPAVGVWVGVGGLLAVFVACIVGTRTERVAAYR